MAMKLTSDTGKAPSLSVYNAMKVVVKSCDCYEKATVQGGDVTQRNPGNKYAVDRGMWQDYADPRKWHEKAAGDSPT